MALVKPKTPEAFEQMSEKILEACDVMKAMASETRLLILCALSDGEMSVNQLAFMTGKSPSAVSQHLSKLKAADLVVSRRSAQTIYYRCSQGVGRSLVDTLCDFYN